jgi:hypothetical protein
MMPILSLLIRGVVTYEPLATTIDEKKRHRKVKITAKDKSRFNQLGHSTPYLVQKSAYFRLPAASKWHISAAHP